MVIICLVFAGLFQVSRIALSREILAHAAACGARARTVGFNYWMVKKAVRVASIPNAGRMTMPEYENVDIALRAAVAGNRPGELWDDVVSGELIPSSGQYNIESARIPEYLGSLHEWRAHYILDYADWGSITFSMPMLITEQEGYAPQLDVNTHQDYLLTVPGHRTFYASDDDRVPLDGISSLEAHFPYYIDDRGW